MKEEQRRAKHEKILALLDKGNNEAAARQARAMTQLLPCDEHWHYLNSVALLKMGRLKSGLAENEWRLIKYSSWPQGTGLPVWNGEKDAKLFISYEQGIADELQWLPILHDVAEAGLQAVVEADSRLLPILRRTFGERFEYVAAPKSRDKSVVFGGHWVVYDTDCTHILPCGSLPYFFRRGGEFEKFKPLKAQKPETQDYVPQFAAKEDSFHVGLAWRSRAEREMYTRLEQWAALFEVPGVTVWNLQYDQEDMDILEAGLPITKVAGLDTFNDIDGLGGFMSLLDVVISPTNAVSKLAGSLGIRTAMLLTSPDHIQFGSSDFPLLPSVVGYTCSDYGDWDKTIAAVVADVARMAHENEHEAD